MAEKKNIVIKLKFPRSDKMLETPVSAPKTITEWNIKRIAFAVGGLAVIIASVLYSFQSSSSKATIDKAVVTVPTQTVASAPDINKPVIDTIQDTAKKKVVRAKLTTKIVDSEPVGEISPPLTADEKNPRPVYYFAELADMKGATVYHEWLLDDKLVSKKIVHISDNPWRTSSRQMIAYTTNSHWTVRLVDETGQVLNEKKFTVKLKK
jgi:hypothetical protein